MSRRWLKAAFLIVGLPTLILAVAAVFGSAAMETADLVGNFSSAYGFLKRLHDNGMAVWLILLGAAAISFAIVAIPAILGRWPFRRSDSPAPNLPKTQSQGSAALEPKNTATLISQRLGNPEIKAIGVLNDVSVQFQRVGVDFRFDCSVGVEFAGLSDGAEWSPFSLRLTTLGGKEELAKLVVPHGALPSHLGQVRYQGIGDWNKLMRSAASTMEGLSFPLNRGPWHGLPPEGPLFCHLELHLPDGKEGQDHRKSQVRLAFEVRGMSFQRAMVRIDPWASEDQATTTTLL